jgi:hypothetical protein
MGFVDNTASKIAKATLSLKLGGANFVYQSGSELCFPKLRKSVDHGLYP